MPRSARNGDDALFRALSQARMRVPHHHVEQVIKLVGESRIDECRSLPAAVRAGRTQGQAAGGR